MSRHRRKRKRPGRRAQPGAQPQGDVEYPLATVIPYGPNDRTVTKLVAAIIRTADDKADPVEQWVATDVTHSEKVNAEIRAFLNAHGVKTVLACPVVLGCPHEEGLDFPRGQDCPFCPFWRGKQGSGSPSDERWDAVEFLLLSKWTGLPEMGPDTRA
jgi:hypothetical protein